MVYSMISSENIAENLEKFERFQLKQEEEYAKLCLQLEVSSEGVQLLQPARGRYIHSIIHVRKLSRRIHFQRFYQNWF
jgi:hypothetical protein